MSRPFRRLLATAFLATISAALLPGWATDEASLLWPLPFREGCTSSFGEYRATHFHMGVDMRTRQQEGWPVLAVEDGAVTRIRREPDGYGRVLYLTLKDGRTAVYAHLCRFSRELGIEARLQDACASKETSFPGDVILDPPVSVRRGQEIARSGQLGLGSPHLHFEIRNGDEACDPFLQGLELPAGMRPPQIRGALFVPRDASGSVDGSFRPLFVSVTPSGKDRWRLARRVTLHGAVDIRLSAEDHLGVLTNTTGVPSLEAAVDGQPIFHMDLRCVSFARYKQSMRLFDGTGIPWNSPGYLLRKAPGMELAGVEGAGLPADLPPGEHSLSVTASNRAGLSAVLEGTLHVVALPTEGYPLSLPGGGYSLDDAECLPAGLWLKLRRNSASGVTPLLWGGRPIEGMRVEVGNGEVHVLLPRESAPKTEGPITAGERTLAQAAGAGPCTLVAGNWVLQIPVGGMGTLDPRDSAKNDTTIVARCGPRSAQSDARLRWKGPIPTLTGIGFSGRWLRGLDGKAIPFRSDGTYALLEDRAAPRWGGLHLATVPNLNAREARLQLTDSLSGPDLHSLRVQLDGQAVYPDWDSEAKVIRLDLTGVSPGRHVLTASCADRAGNRSKSPPLAFTSSTGPRP